MLHVHPVHAVCDVRHLLRKVEALARRLLALLGSARRSTVHAGALLGRALAVLLLGRGLLVVSLRLLGVRVTGADASVAGIRVLALRRVCRRV